MKYRGLIKNQKRVLEALDDAPKFSELMAKLKNKPSGRHVRTILGQLEAKGLAYDPEKGKRGRSPHRWYRNDSACENASTQQRPARLAKCHDELTIPIYESASQAITAIRASSRCRERKRIREVCNQHIRPVFDLIRQYYSLEHSGPERVIPRIRLPTIAEFLTEPMYDDFGRRIHIKAYKRGQTRVGTIGVRHPKSSSSQDLFYPTLEEWDQYLNHIVWLLRGEHLAHVYTEFRWTQEVPAASSTPRTRHKS